MPHADILHPALHALPDVTLAVEPGALRLLDVNRAEAFGYPRDALGTLALDALVVLDRSDLERFVLTADGRAIDVGVRLADGSVVHATASAATSAGAAAQPCVLVVIREATEHARVLDEVERLRELVFGAAESLARLSARRRTAPPPEVEEDATALVEEDVAPAWVPDLSLAQYASFRVESELNPATAREVDARYGLPTEASRSELHRVWAERLNSDPALAAQCTTLSAQYRDWYLAQQRAREASMVFSTPNPPGTALGSPSSVATPAPPSVSGVIPAPAPSSPAPSGPDSSRRAQRITAPAAPAAAVEQRAAPLPFNPAEVAPVAISQAPQVAMPIPTLGVLNVRATIGVNDAPVGGEALPFKNAGPPDLTVEQFAALGVELEAYPDQRADVLSMYGITNDAAWRATDSVWASRFATDAVLRQRWMKLVSDLRGKLVRK